jgi:hypothetical protein
MRMTTRAVALVVGIASMGVGISADALAASWRIHDVLGGPALLGNRVGWVSRRADGGGDLRIARPGHAPRRIQGFRPGTVPPGSGPPEIGFTLAGSNSSVLLQASRGCDPDCGARSDIYAGPRGGRLGRIERCHVFLHGIDVSGRRAAFSNCQHRLVVRDLSGAQPDTVLGAGEVFNAQIAGHYAAWMEVNEATHRFDVVVYDLKQGTTAYVLKAPRVTSPSGSLALQGDGKVAIVYDPHPNSSAVQAAVAWASRQEPRVHRLKNLPSRTSYFVRMGNDRVAFARTKADTDARMTEIGLTPLDGAAELITRRGLTDVLDFDGRRLAYVEKANDRVWIRRRTLP